VCTSRAVCDALADVGGDNVCRFTDLSHYDGRPFASSSAPCRASFGVLCGGSCGFCENDVGYCTGRSPAHAFGLCNHYISSYLPSTCDECAAWNTCAQFESPDATAALGHAYGVCMQLSDCLAVGKLVGVGCWVNGSRVGP
jgi:hypothetical protein